MVNYDIFVAVFGILSLFYLFPVAVLDSYNVPMVAIALDALNVIFWFCAAVATAAYLGVHSCNNRVSIPIPKSQYQRINTIHRPTQQQTTSPTARPTQSAAAAKPKPRQRSSSSASSRGWHLSSFPSCLAAATSTCAVVSAVADLR